jgi:hypothetical protein
MKIIPILASALMVLAPTFAIAQDKATLPAFEFRGHVIGEPAEKHFPYWAEDFRTRLKNRLPGCIKDEVPGMADCADVTAEKEGQFGKTRFVGDTPIHEIRYVFLDGRLATLKMFFDFDSTEAIRQMLIAKYGKPASEKIGLLGSVETRWAFREGTLLLTMNPGPRFASSLVFENPTADPIIAERRAAVAKQKAKGAF